MVGNKNTKLTNFFLSDSNSSSEKSLGVVMATVIQESEPLVPKSSFSFSLYRHKIIKNGPG